MYFFFSAGYELTGLARGGEQLSRLKRNYAKAVELLVELASLQVWIFVSISIKENVKIQIFWCRTFLINVLCDSFTYRPLLWHWTRPSRSQTAVWTPSSTVRSHSLLWREGNLQASFRSTRTWRSSVFPLSDYSQDRAHAHVHHYWAGWAGARGILQVRPRCNTATSCDDNVAYYCFKHLLL